MLGLVVLRPFWQVADEARRGLLRARGVDHLRHILCPARAELAIDGDDRQPRLEAANVRGRVRRDRHDQRAVAVAAARTEDKKSRAAGERTVSSATTMVWALRAWSGEARWRGGRLIFVVFVRGRARRVLELEARVLVLLAATEEVLLRRARHDLNADDRARREPRLGDGKALGTKMQRELEAVLVLVGAVRLGRPSSVAQRNRVLLVPVVSR